MEFVEAINKIFIGLCRAKCLKDMHIAVDLLIFITVTSHTHHGVLNNQPLDYNNNNNIYFNLQNWRKDT